MELIWEETLDLAWFSKGLSGCEDPKTPANQRWSIRLINEAPDIYQTVYAFIVWFPHSSIINVYKSLWGSWWSLSENFTHFWLVAILLPATRTTAMWQTRMKNSCAKLEASVCGVAVAGLIYIVTIREWGAEQCVTRYNTKSSQSLWVMLSAFQFLI